MSVYSVSQDMRCRFVKLGFGVSSLNDGSARQAHPPLFYYNQSSLTAGLSVIYSFLVRTDVGIHLPLTLVLVSPSEIPILMWFNRLSERADNALEYD